MKTIAASKFKEQCLAILDDVDAEGIIITKRGKPVAKLTPVSGDLSDLYGKYRDRIQVHGDLMSTGIEWDAQR